MSEPTSRDGYPINHERLTQEQSRLFADKIDSLEPFFEQRTLEIPSGNEGIDPSEPDAIFITGRCDTLGISLTEGREVTVSRYFITKKDTEGKDVTLPGRWMLTIESPFQAYGEKATPQRGSIGDFRGVLRSAIKEALNLDDEIDAQLASEILRDFGLRPDDLEDPTVVEVQQFEVTDYFYYLVAETNREFVEINPSTGRRATLQPDSQERLWYKATQGLPEDDPRRQRAQGAYFTWLHEQYKLRSAAGEFAFTEVKLQESLKILSDVKEKLLSGQSKS